ncbi:hypothetical protein FRC09_017417 [Ceratobasidium sp. 395]|nr:hypothetical protein FRC09_017417 [Ceratobasidium sp. 395]
MAEIPSRTTNVDPAYLYKALSKEDIISLVARSAPEHRPLTRVTKYMNRSKQELLDILLKDDHYWTEELYKIAVDNQEDRARKQREKGRRHIEHVRTVRQEQAKEEYPNEEFLDLSSDANNMRCYVEAHNATSNAALEHRICAICARLRLGTEGEFTRMRVTDIPNRHRLRPNTPHPDQVLAQGCLLEVKGCHGAGPDPLADVCKECLNELQATIDVDTPPKHSLANDLWIGDVPWQLAHLTFAENLLVARIYPRIFLIKLYPRDKSRRHLPLDQVQTALRGNVVSFELNSPALANMVSGQLMPQKPNILASTLSITFVGRGKITDPARLHMLRVRRWAVGEALTWLKEHNKKYYGDIVIDQDRLNALPPDGVPEAISEGIRYEADESMANDEYHGYKPNSYYSDEADVEAVTSVEDDPSADDNGGPDVIPIQYLGVMDSDQSKVPSDELMGWGLNNMLRHTDNTREPGYAIRHGAAPVNTFGQPPAGEGPADPNRDNFWEAAFPGLHPRGLGGIERDRPAPLSLNDHGRWLLDYHDRRFRIHHSFPFVLFGMQQRRQGLLSTKLQMNRFDFDRIAHTLDTITPADLRRAAEEESRAKKEYNCNLKASDGFGGKSHTAT